MKSTVNPLVPTVFLNQQVYDLVIQVGKGEMTENVRAKYRGNDSISDTVILPNFERLDDVKPKTFSIRKDLIKSAKAI